MKEYIFVGDDIHYYITKADNEKQAVLNLYEWQGGSNLFCPKRLEALREHLDTFELIKLYEKEHGKITQFGEFSAIYGKPISV